MATQTVTTVEASPASADATSPGRQSSEALWDEVERSVRGAALDVAAPHCEAVRRMAYLHCWALCHSSKQSDIQELWASEALVEEFADFAVVEPIKEMARHMMWSVQEESATGPSQVHLRTSAAANAERTHVICEQLLRPHLGSERTQAVWSMCHECAWEAHQAKQRRKDDAAVHRLWAEHHARRMGFDEDLAPLPGNHAVVALCYHLCRHWTSSNATDGAVAKEELTLREADFQIALQKAKEVVAPEVVHAVVDMQRELRRGIFLNRLSDRKNPGQFVTNLLRNTAGQAKGAEEAARGILDERLAPLIGEERADEVWGMCHSCAWHVQNRYDYESAAGGRLTGARVGYLQDAERDWAAVQGYSARMGFSSA